MRRASMSLAIPLFALVLPGSLRGTLAYWLLIATAAVALNLVCGLAGQISLGHAALVGIGAYTAALVSRDGGPGFPWTLLAAGGAGVLAGLVFGVPSLRVRGQYLALVTLAGGFIFFRVAAGASFTGGEAGFGGITPLRLGGSDVTATGQVLAAGLVLAAAVWGADVIGRSWYGRELAATKDSEIGAESIGVDVMRTKMTIFVLSSVIAAVAGAMLAHTEGFISAQAFDVELSLSLVIACIIGGLGRPLGAVVGVFIIALPSLWGPQVAGYGFLASAVVALIVLFAFPEGIVGTLRLRRGLYGLGSLRPVAGKHQVPPHSVTAAGIEIHLLSKRFGNVVALDGVSITCAPGRIHAVIGPNGSGKTTLVNCMTGVLIPDSGKVDIDGVDVTGWRPSRVARLGMGRTFQEQVAFPSLTVLESAALGAGRRDPTPRAMQALALVGLTVDPTASSADLSYGQARRLELARVLASTPRILVLDEPSAGRNATESEDLVALLRELREVGMTILLVDHNMDLVMKVADVVTVLEDGRVLTQGKPSDVSRHPEVVRAYLGPRVVSK
ncbi:MAG TPA: branched-chain amino acid ABC transporter ATP-binding protein/permease [Actinomycetota bacterium]|nr:branched-chain amino acid ABC transporter ATP-binding protein/permease [Actinomycetota bacterium]